MTDFNQKVNIHTRIGFINQPCNRDINQHVGIHIMQSFDEYLHHREKKL